MVELPKRGRGEGGEREGEREREGGGGRGGEDIVSIITTFGKC